jgi:hypothetical protein
MTRDETHADADFSSDWARFRRVLVKREGDGPGSREMDFEVDAPGIGAVASDLPRSLDALDTADAALERELESISDDQHLAAMRRIRERFDPAERDRSQSDLDSAWTSVEDVLAADPKFLNEIDALTSDERTSSLQVEVYNLGQSIIELREEIQVLAWKKQKAQLDVERAQSEVAAAGRTADAYRNAAIADVAERTKKAAADADEALVAARQEAASVLAEARKEAGRITARASAQEAHARRLDALAHERIVRADRRVSRARELPAPDRTAGGRPRREACTCARGQSSTNDTPPSNLDEALIRLACSTRSRNRRATAQLIDALLKSDSDGHAHWLLKHVMAAGLRLIDNVELTSDLAEQFHLAARQDEMLLKQTAAAGTRVGHVANPEACVGTRVGHGRRSDRRMRELARSDASADIVRSGVPQEVQSFFLPLIGACARHEFDMEVTAVGSNAGAAPFLVTVSVSVSDQTECRPISSPTAGETRAAMTQGVLVEQPACDGGIQESTHGRAMGSKRSMPDVDALEVDDEVDFRQILGWHPAKMLFWNVAVVFGSWLAWLARQLKVGLCAAATPFAPAACISHNPEIGVGNHRERSALLGGQHLQLPS